MPQIDGYNSDIQNEQVQKLAELFPEVVREGKVDFGALKATLGEDIELGEKYGLSWKGKSNVFAKIQEKTVSTLHPQLEESVDWDTTQNMFIEGDNLEALKVLHKAYYGKIKMIYIDPPYNTGNDFVYNDDFKKTRREQALEEGAIDDEGNVTRDDGLRVNTGGHKHSNWLDMMYPRLFLARNLLRQDGVIFVSIDDNEVHNLRLMMNEIFGEENFVADFIWKHRKSSQNDTDVSLSHNYTLCFARRRDNFKLTPLSIDHTKFDNPDNDPRGPWVADPFDAPNIRPNLTYPVTNPITGEQHLPPGGRHWRISKEKFASALADNRIVWGKNGKGRPQLKRFLSEAQEKGKNPFTVWDHLDTATGATKELMKLFDGKKIFDTPKPVSLIKEILRLSTSAQDDIALDFFGGSGTLAHATMELNVEDGGKRKWIIVQLPENIDEDHTAFKDGYKTIAEIARERIRRAHNRITDDFDIIAKRNNSVKRQANSSENKTVADVFRLATQEVEQNVDFGFRSYLLGGSNFKKWNELVADPDEIKQQALDSLNPLEDGVTDDDLLTEILLKRGVSPLAEVEACEGFVIIPSENLAISLSRHMTEELFAQILAKSPSQIILLDQAFKDDVNLKTNLILQAEKQNITVEVL